MDFTKLFGGLLGGGGGGGGGPQPKSASTSATSISSPGTLGLTGQDLIVVASAVAFVVFAGLLVFLILKK